MLNLKRLLKSFKYAWKGITHTFRTEQNFRIQLYASILVVFISFYYHIRTWEAVAVILSVMMVLVLELINTTFERMVDILIPRMHHYVKDIKDIMAATVLLAALSALIIGILIFWPYIVK